jgi:hypothetical protein
VVWPGGVNLTVDPNATAAPLSLVLNANERQPGMVATTVDSVRVSFCGAWDQTVPPASHAAVLTGHPQRRCASILRTAASRAPHEKHRQ